MPRSFKIPEYVKKNFDKYKYVLLVCAVGLLLALLGGGRSNAAKESAAAGAPEELAQLGSIERSLEETFSAIEGVGRVRVMLSVRSGYEYVYAYNQTKNADKSQDSASSGTQTQLVTVTAGGEQSPVLIRVDQPVFMGAVVVCDGGDDARLKLALTEAVCSLTGLSYNKVIILKMNK